MGKEIQKYLREINKAHDDLEIEVTGIYIMFITDLNPLKSHANISFTGL